MRKLRILVVDDELAMRESIAAWLREYGHLPSKAGGGEQALEMLQEEHFDLALLDIKMPGMDGLELLRLMRESHPDVMAIMVTAFGSIESAVSAMKAGAHDYLLKPFDPQQLVLLLEKTQQHKRLMEDNLVLKEALRQGQCHGFEDMVASSPAMLELFDLLEQVAITDAPVLILGETGTGKELVARAIHNRSKRVEGHFVPLNCGAQSDSLLESELFGHERGAFTGAVKARRGRLEMADGGTLFLDEVGEIPEKMQVQLLRVLEDGEFQRVGGDRYLSSDFRLISATHRNPQDKNNRHRFRTDFLYRINVVTLEIPALRDRAEDVRPLAEHFLGQFSRQTGKHIKGLTQKAAELLRGYAWPGNVRELRNVMERAVILGKGDEITSRDLRFFAKSADAEAPLLSMAQMEEQHISRTLEHCSWNISHAARRLGINRSTLTRKINKMNLTKDTRQ
jgi:DNA-binding NtrC family response regulator